MLISRAAIVLVVAVLAPVAYGEERSPVSPPPAMSAAEQGFANAMSGAVLVGRFTASDSAEARPERYELGEVRKVGDDLWLFQARIKYGDHDVTLPITLPVKWAGDTAVIVVDNVGFPGLGVYSARVMIHDGKYAGYWYGGDHGGHLFGKLEKQPAEKPSAESPTPDAQ